MAMVLVVPASAQDARVEAARKEGKVVWYTSLALSSSERVAKLFEAAYPGIGVEVHRTGSQRILQRVMQELQANLRLVDVIHTSDAGHFVLLKAKKLLMKYTPVGVDAFPPGFKDRDGYSYGLRATVNVIAYNSKVVPAAEAPTPSTRPGRRGTRSRSSTPRKACRWSSPPRRSPPGRRTPAPPSSSPTSPSAERSSRCSPTPRVSTRAILTSPTPRTSRSSASSDCSTPTPTSSRSATRRSGSASWSSSARSGMGWLMDRSLPVWVLAALALVLLMALPLGWLGYISVSSETGATLSHYREVFTDPRSEEHTSEL